MNVVTSTVEAVGGVVMAAAIGRVAPETIYRSQVAGKIAGARAVLLLAHHVHPTDPAAAQALAFKLAGIK